MKNKEIVIDILTMANVMSTAGKKMLNDGLEEYNINYIEYHILRQLEKHPGETQYGLLQYTMLTKSRINQITKKLESMGFLEKRVQMVGALLKKPLYLTDLGEELVNKGIDYIYENTLKNIDDKDILKYSIYREQMVDILEDMNLTLGSRTPEYLKK